MDSEFSFQCKRIKEIILRASNSGRTLYSAFLSPPEWEFALRESKRYNMPCTLFGGYPQAERCMAGFGYECEESTFPLEVIKLTWSTSKAPSHRDILGSVLGLGIERSCVGDIVIMDDVAYLICQTVMASHIKDQLISAGKVRLTITSLDSIPSLFANEGKKVSGTVAAPRLDAVIATGFHLSRSKAGVYISSGMVKLRHFPTDKSDTLVNEGDVISVRGLGRLLVESLGKTTKKGRIFITLQQFSNQR